MGTVPIISIILQTHFFLDLQAGQFPRVLDRLYVNLFLGTKIKRAHRLFAQHQWQHS